MKNGPKEKLIVILGPTASGKTDLGIFLAKKYDGEIISADSRLVYEGMDIGTAKPEKDTGTEGYVVKGIPHHLIDICSPKKPFNAALFKKKAIKEIKNIQKKNKNAFMVGGTGLYIDAVANNLDFPKIIADERLREELERTDMDSLFIRYQELDPVGAENIDRKNKRRLIRAIEVCKSTGKSFWENRKLKEPIFDILKIGIVTERESILDRIIRRVDKMLKKGLEEEAACLIGKYGNIPPLQTIGYQEWKDYLEKAPLDKTDIALIRERIIINTNKFAKRQMTWFKKDKEIHWIKDKKEASRLVSEFLGNKKRPQ
ncbi:MAG: tRNA (adenosine(37)-N6)-dimethylallyltransferase MiaA [Candidatus Pacebacteria bacterium]|nr:tRNA (adenosine(37)-N6)-dimethylallyltransferase MiaA [Candidatus Paceibacterota bacterium]